MKSGISQKYNIAANSFPGVTLIYLLDGKRGRFSRPIFSIIQIQHQMISRLMLILLLFLTGCDLFNSKSDDFGNCEPGPYFTYLPVDEEQINYFLVLGQFNPPGDVFPRGQTGLQLKSRQLIPIYAVGDIEIR